MIFQFLIQLMHNEQCLLFGLDLVIVSHNCVPYFQILSIQVAEF